MRRYFDLPDERNTLMIDVDAGSPAALAPAEKVAAHFKQPGRIREIEKNEYIRLTRQYAGHKIPDDWVPGQEASNDRP